MRKSGLTARLLPDFCLQHCNKGDSEFDRELEQVIFSHVKEADKLGKRSLKVLIEHKTSEVKEAITQLITEIQQMNKKIVTVQDFLAPHYRKLIENKLEGKKQELAAHRDSVPAEVPNPETQKDQENRNSVLKELDNAKKHIREIGEEIAETEKKIEALAIEKAQVEKGENKIINLKAAIERIRTEFGQLRLDGISFDDVIKIQYNDHLLEKKKTHIRAEKVNLQSRLDESQSTGLPSQKKAAQEKVALLQEKLDEPNKAYQQYLKEVDRWKNQERKILNGEPDSIQSYQNILQKIGEKPEELRKLNKLRLDTTKKIFEQLQRLVATYKELYAPVQDFINRNPLATKFSLNFDVSIKDMGFGEQFFEWINQSVSGTFCGKDPGRKMLEELLLACNFNDWAQVETFLESITHRLDHDVRLDPPSAVQVKDQMRKSKSVESLYDFIFSLEYLVPRYVLKMGDKEMYQLSPGEKGTLLLVFYLLVDHDDIPLIIDQPEENLDNQTVYELLVPSISQARQRRQIIIVTHNPNLAVVCDAEQIIYATMDKKNGNKVTYTTGAIENPEINKYLLDVLEGTRPAFDKRNSKYIP